MQLNVIVNDYDFKEKAIDYLKKNGYLVIPKENSLDLHARVNIDQYFLDHLNFEADNYIRRELIHGIADEIMKTLTFTNHISEKKHWKDSNVFYWKPGVDNFSVEYGADLTIIPWRKK